MGHNNYPLVRHSLLAVALMVGSASCERVGRADNDVSTASSSKTLSPPSEAAVDARPTPSDDQPLMADELNRTTIEFIDSVPIGGFEDNDFLVFSFSSKDGLVYERKNGDGTKLDLASFNCIGPKLEARLNPAAIESGDVQPVSSEVLGKLSLKYCPDEIFTKTEAIELLNTSSES